MIKIQTIERYQRGTNEILDGVLGEHDIVFIVQGSIGRMPILANDAEEAKEIYLSRKVKVYSYDHNL